MTAASRALIVDKSLDVTHRNAMSLCDDRAALFAPSPRLDLATLVSSMRNLHNLDEDLLVYLTSFIDLCDAISLSQTSRSIFELATQSTSYWRENLASIKPVYLARVQPWSEYTAGELRDAAILSRKSDLIWTKGREFVTKRWTQLPDSSPGELICFVPRTRWALYFKQDEPTSIKCYDIKTGQLAGSFTVQGSENPAVTNRRCAHAKSISSNEVRIICSLSGDTISTILLVYQITFMESSSPSSKPTFSISEKRVFSIEKDYLSLSFSGDGKLLALSDESAVTLINIDTGVSYKWNYPMTCSPGSVDFSNELLVMLFGDGDKYRLATIHVPSILRSSAQSPTPLEGGANTIKDEEINFLPPSDDQNGEDFFLAIEEASNWWLLPPRSNLRMRDEGTAGHRSIDIVFLTDEYSCSYGTLSLDGPVHTLDQARLEDHRRTTIICSLPRAETEQLRVDGSHRTILYRNYLTFPGYAYRSPDRSTIRVHVVGVDKPGASRPLVLPPECVEKGVFPSCGNEATGVVIALGFDRPNGVFVFWFV
ncbi:hypothetical protein FRC17_001616 [Serendipita sp. 399]|nr:hypothetical protein FRC17_001616 [Serendipita sp. 399]